ncbi:MAG: tetratricopeptide repeat protein [Proteobacteria bacterium]|nr:tetratricopeptide repeat protein [Pseudomonadota bacterium]
MPYVRKKGNQVVVVHGERDSVSGKVQQRTLFAFYSKAEALSATGDSSHWFQRTLQDEFPGIRFSWKKLSAGIKEHMEILPDLYEYKKERVHRHFRTAIVDLTRELLVADPQTLISSARLLQEQRLELEYLRGLIDWRLKLADQKPSEWNRDDPFYWRTLMNRRSVPPEGMEQLSERFNKREYDKAGALAKLLTECWDNYAEGYNYIGLIALDRDELDIALTQFEKAMEVGRTLFPKRIGKDSYWSDHSTRPYIRSLVYLAQTHNRLGDFEEALTYCVKLDKECHQDVTAAMERIPIYMNSGAFHHAVDSAKFVHMIYPHENLPLAFALHEIGDEYEARVHFLAGAIRFPRSARMLCGYSRTTDPKAYEEVEDHNSGVHSLRDLTHYLSSRTGRTTRFFKETLRHRAVSRMVDEAKDVRHKWRENRSADRTWFDRMTEMESFEFAESKAREIWPVGSEE